MNFPELFLGGLILKALLDGNGKKPSGGSPTAHAPVPPAQKPPPQIPPSAPAKPNDVPWPQQGKVPLPISTQAGVPGASATAKPGPAPAPKPWGSPGGTPFGAPGAPPAGVPGASATIGPPPPPPVRPPPPPPDVDEKMPQAQKAGPAVSNAAQRGIDAMKQNQGGTGKRQFRPKRKHLTQANIARAKALLGGWQKGKTWSDADDPSVKYVAALHPGKTPAAGQRKAIEVWSSNPDDW